MAIAELVMPKLGESIMEATILKWHKQVGDFVKHDETVLDIATDKVDSEVPSTEQGILLEILYNVNDVVPIGTVIARIQTSVDAIAPAAPAPVVEPVVVPEPIAAPAPISYQAPVEPAPVAAFVAPVPEPQVPYTPSAYELPDKPIGNRFYSPLVLNIANSEGISLSELERIPGTGNEGRVSKKDVLQYVADKKAGKIPVYQPAPVYQAPPPVYQQPVAPVASAPVYQEPVAAAPVYQEPVAPAPVAAPVEAIAPAAPVAPVVPEPVAAPIAAAYKAPTVPQQITIPEPVAPAPVTAAPAPVAAAPVAPAYVAPAPVAAPISVAAPVSTVPLSAPVASSGKFSNPASVTLTGATEIQEMDRMRKLIAKHMVDSKHTSPHVTSFTEADVTNMVNWRSKVKDEFEKREGTKLTFTPMFIECIAEVIKKFPLVNCSIDGDNVIIRKDINIGMATALPSGNLIVPVIKGADQLNIVGLSKAVNGLADAARNTRLKPEDTQGGTFTLTNVGTFGSLMGTPIIPQPQVAILAVGAIKKRPMVMETPEGDIIAIRHMMYLSMSYDHRIVDGSIGASFLTAVAKAFENWDPNKQWFQYL
ncbi:MAG: diapophytoene dehydrogenase [Chitinophagaceae bacterium BSSC1]|nr:MAG: diapophytoene dehydrogenase [Chitinophagaceae bacterium BSSC1]